MCPWGRFLKSMCSQEAFPEKKKSNRFVLYFEAPCEQDWNLILRNDNWYDDHDKSCQCQDYEKIKFCNQFSG